MEQSFVHLRLHTEFSLTDGILRIPTLYEKAKEFEMPALAITDLSNLYATVKFYQAAFKKGIKPIIGADLRILKNPQSNDYFMVTLLCLNNLGYKNLTKIVSESFLKGQKSGLPIVSPSWLEKYNEGLIVICGDTSDIGLSLLEKDQQTATTQLNFWKELFKDRLYLEISRIGKPQENFYINEVLSLAQTFHIPVVATNDVRFLERSDYEAHETKVCIQEAVILNDPTRKRRYSEQQYFRSQKEMVKLFEDIPEAIANTLEIAKRCNVTFTLGNVTLPHFKVPEGYDSATYLEKLAREGLNSRLEILRLQNNYIDTKPYEDRLSLELNVINNMGFAGYFLIVADFTRWAKEHGIPVGPGRGSGPGSLVAYTLKITDLDPIKLELLFERFLNPERVSMPDFDIDFCIEGRDRVIEYVMEKHGENSVSQIITYGTMAAKAVIRDVGRVLGLSYGYVDKIAKLIPFELGMTLDKALVQEPLLRERYNTEEDVKTLIDLAKKLEGLTRNVGKHAGGIVIAPGELTDFVPLYCEPSETSHPVTQFDKDDVEVVGLVKFDFLGLKTLTIINRALHDINEVRIKNNDKPLDISLIPLDDLSTYTLLRNCQSTAVFQLESPGMRDLMKRLQPDCFEDLIALVALFRPGPLQAGAADDFINRKHGRARIEYLHESLIPILKPTYGALVYQEQVMQIAQRLAGYTLGAADILRKAMGKKKPEEMAKQREIFCQGAQARGVSYEVVTQLFDAMEKFAGYGFNKSHSASYALIAYQTAYLKTHYKSSFMAAVLSSEMDKTDKIVGLLNDCQDLKIHVSPPNINKSEFHFKMVDDNNILYGLGAIKGAGEAAIENIVNARNLKGPFKNLFDFCQRIDLRKLNRRLLEALIKSGSFDIFKKNRATLLASLNNALAHAEQILQNQTFGQCDLLQNFSTIDENDHSHTYVEVEPFSSDLQLQGEKETLGFYLSGHPLNRYLSELSQITTCRISELSTNLTKALVAGIILSVRIRQTRRGDRIAIFKLDDGTQQIDVVCFSECFNNHRSLIVQDQLLIVDGEVSFDEFNNSIRLTAKSLFSLDDVRANGAKRLKINVTTFQRFDVHLFDSFMNQYQGGQCEVILNFVIDKTNAALTLGKRWLVRPSEDLIEALTRELGADKVEIFYN